MKAFTEGLFKRLGEHLASFIIWTVIIIASPIVAWFTAPTTYTLQLSRGEIVACVALFLVLIAITVWITQRVTLHRHPKRKSFASVDEVQRNILRIMWTAEGGCLGFSMLKGILRIHDNHVRLACERLQERGFIACNTYNPDPLVQLLPEGREYAEAHQLTNAGEILERANSQLGDLR